MKKRLLYFTSSLGVGGAETMLKDYCAHLSENIFDITVLVLDYSKGTIIEKELKRQAKNVNIVFVDKKPSFVALFLNKLLRLLRVKLFLKKNKFDIIHTHLDVNRFLLPSLNKDFSGKMFHTIHAPVAVSFCGSKRKDKERKAVQGLILKYKMVLICLHEEMNKEARKMFNTSDVITISNAIDVNYFLNHKLSKERARELFNIPTDCYLLGHIGRFSPAKNHRFIIDVFEGLTKNRNDAMLLLVGDGELKKEIREEVVNRNLEDKVIFLMPRSDIPELLSSLDWFIFPSLYESFGISLLEAQVIGIPTIASNHIPQCVLINNNVYVKDLKDIKSWVKILSTHQNNLKTRFDDYIEYDICTIVKQLEMAYLKEE